MKMIIPFLLCLFLAVQTFAASMPTSEANNSHAKAEEIAEKGEETSVMYNLISSTIHAMHKFVVLGLFGRFADVTKPLFQIIVSVYLFFTVVIWMKTKSIDILKFLWVMAGIIFAFSVVYGKGNFERFVYKPIISTTMQTANFMITTSSGDETPKYSGKDPLFNMLKYMEQNVHNIMKIGDRLSSKAENYGITDFFKAVGYSIKGLIVSFIYFALMLIFGIMYMLGIVALHFLLVFTPFAVLIGSIPLARSLLLNWLKGLFTFMLIPIFASIAMGATIFILQDVNTSVSIYLAASAKTPVPQGLYTQVIMVGLFSAYFHLKAPEFASTIVGGPISNFGTVFTAGTAVGIAGIKTAALPAAQKFGRFAKNNINRLMDR
tara:strand:- start:22614 stop:23744 length:1131 start_codon:yes stop_codon:yes gene_type:complete